MLKFIFIFTLFFVNSKYIFTFKIDDELDINLQLIKHQPCAFKADKSNWVRKLEFEGGTDQVGPKLVPQPNAPNCYTLAPNLTVYSEFKGDLSIYLEFKNSLKTTQVPESCSNRRADGCGGFGSCLYCDACETLDKNKELKSRLLLNGKPISCADKVKPGVYDNLQLEFCLPGEEFLKTQGLTKENLKNLIQGQGEKEKNSRSIGIFITVYFFDTDVRKLIQTQQKVEGVYRKTKRSFFKDESLPADVYWALPFNSIIKEQRMFVGCHKIYGNVQIRLST